MLLTLALSRPHTTTPEMLEQAMQCPNDPVFGLKWYIVPLFVIWLFLIVNEIRQKRFSVVFGAAAFWLWDVFNETWNAMVYATTGQPVWGTTAAGGSALQILVGYNIEISFMFFILGMLTCNLLKTSEGYGGQGFFDANKNWLDDPNNMYYKANKKKSELTPEEYKTKVKAILGRIGVIVFGSIAAVIIEILLNKCNVLTFPYRVRSVLRCGGRHSRFAEKMAAYRAWRDIIRRRIVAYYFGLAWYAWSSDRRTRQLDRKILRRRQRNYQSDTSRINRHFLQDKGG